jgi:hypothetical protein
MSIISRESQMNPQPTFALPIDPCACGCWFMMAIAGVPYPAIAIGSAQVVSPAFANIYQLAYAQAVRTTLASLPGRNIEPSLN